MVFGKLARDMNQAAADGEFAPAIGRDDEAERLAALIQSDETRRIVLKGPPGVGKTSLIHELARRMADSELPARLYDVNPAALSANTVMVRDHLGAFLDLCRTQRGAWAVIDEFSALASTGAVLNELHRKLIHEIESSGIRALLAVRSELFAQLEKEGHPVIAGAAVVDLPPLDAPSTAEILYRIKPRLEEENTTLIAHEAIAETVSLAQQYQPGGALPGTAIHLLSRACRRHHKKTELQGTPPPWMDKSTMKHLGKAVGQHDIRRALDDLTGLDVTAIEREGWKDELAAGLAAAIPGRDASVLRLAAAVALARHSMIVHSLESANIVLAGPPGTRKTHAARMLAQSLPGDSEGAYLFDLATFDGPDAKDRLFTPEGGAIPGPPRPLAVNVFKSLHKAAPEVRREIGRTLSTSGRSSAFPWTRGFRRVLNIVTFDATDTYVVSTDLIRRAERLLELDQGQFKGEAVYFAPTR